MPLDPTPIRDLLDGGAVNTLEVLFTDPGLLGWGRPAPGEFPLPLDDDADLLAEPVALLGGVGVYRCSLPDEHVPGVVERRAHLDRVGRQHAGSLLVYQTPQGCLTFSYVRPREGGRAEIRTLRYEPGSPARTTLERLGVLRFDPTELGLLGDPGATAVRDRLREAFSVETVSTDFFRDYERAFSHAKARITGLADEALHLFTQRLFNRLLFLRFLERKGWLRFGDSGSRDYLGLLWKDRAAGADTFYSERLELLFFDALNDSTDPDLRSPATVALVGSVPFLNGGLFEKHPDDGHAVVSDDALAPFFNDVLYQYNFTVSESTPLDIEVAVDPEMLGRVFEQLVIDRLKKGKYYTPRSIVSFMCKEALKGFLGAGAHDLVDEHDNTRITVPQAKALREKLENLRVCDPACGSGAYLLGMLHELHQIYGLLDTRALDTPRDDYARKLLAIRRNLYGVDLDPFAVEIARLRLWLSLAVEFDGDTPEPLPNLRYRIEQGDSLTAPDPTAPGVFEDAIRQHAATFERLTNEHVATHDRARKAELDRDIAVAEVALKHALQGNEAPAGALDWRLAFPGVFWRRPPQATITGALNLGQELAEPPPPGGFDIVLANPPYGGTPVATALRDRYFPGAGERGMNKDPYGIFVARGLQLLRPGGHLCYIVSDTWRTIKTFRPLRHRLLSQTTVQHVIDVPGWIFDAAVNTSILTLRKAPAPDDHRLIAGDLRGIKTGDWATLDNNLLALAGHASDVQTTRYARYTYPQALIWTYDTLPFFIGSPGLLRLMTDAAFLPLRSVADAKQGLITADNPYYLRRRVGTQTYAPLDPASLLTTHEVDGLSDAEKQNGVDPADYDGRHFLPFDKGGSSDAAGGWLPNYHVPTDYFIDWSKAAVHRLRTATQADIQRAKGSSRIAAAAENRVASRFQNAQYYFKSGVTFSPTGQYSPTFRFGSGTVFGNKGSTIFSDTLDLSLLIGLLTSATSRYLLKTYVSHTVETGEEVLMRLPIPTLTPAQEARVEEIVGRIVDNQETDPAYAYFRQDQPALDATVAEAFVLTGEELREIELWFCRRYRGLAEAQGVLAAVKQKHAAYLAWANTVISKPPRYWRDHPVRVHIAQGEGQTMEFKQTLHWDDRQQVKNTDVFDSALKAVAAFLNADGGTLLIGVADAGTVHGLGPDYALFTSGASDDKFERKLRDRIRSTFDPPPVAELDVRFHALPEGTVCEVRVQPRASVTRFSGEVYVRSGNQSPRLTDAALAAWEATAAAGQTPPNS